MNHLFYEDDLTSMNDYLLTRRLDMSMVTKINKLFKAVVKEVVPIVPVPHEVRHPFKAYKSEQKLKDLKKCLGFSVSKLKM